MGHQPAETDPESLERSGGRRGCLDTCLVLSVVVLFVAVAAVAVGGVMVVMDLQSKVKLSPAPEFKMQNFAYLMAKSSQLRNSTMLWGPVSYAASGSVGSRFAFDPEQQWLRPESEGIYFMYVELNFTCTATCGESLLAVSVGSAFSCEVRLPAAADATPVSRKCWTVSQMSRQKLQAQMTVQTTGKQQYWKLELKGSGFGMFLID